MKAKCEKGKNGKWAFNKPLGVCVSADSEDKPMCEEGEDCEDMPQKPDCEEEECDEKPEKPMWCEEGEDCEEKPEHDDDMPDVFGDEGKWTKCEPEPVDNGKLHCTDVKCMLYCMEGFMVEGNGKAKCEKNKNGEWKFNKEFGTCVECEDCPEVEMPEMPEKPEEADPEENPEDEEEDMTDDEEEENKPDDENPGCKSFEDMGLVQNDDLTVGCKVNGKKQYICKVECANDTNFMGKDGKTGTKLTCKCKNGVCKWQNDKKKTVNGKKIKTYACE